MFKTLEKIINKLENQSFGFIVWLISFLSIILIRIGLEIFAYNKGVPFDLLAFSHAILFFSAPMLTLTFIIYLLTKENIIKISKIFLFGWMLSWIPPVVDLLISKGGGFSLTYLFISVTDLPKKFITFFGTSLEQGVTYGARAMVLAICLFLALYIFVKTRNILKSILSLFLGYLTIFFYVSLPSLATAIEKGNASLSQGEVIFSLALPREIFSIMKSSPVDYFDFEMCLVLFPLVVFQLAIYLFLYQKEKFIALIKNVRPTRLLLQIIALGSGLYLGHKLTGLNFDLSFFGLLTLFALFFIIFFSWLFSIGINDIYDFAIDRISNRGRPLVKNITTPREYSYLCLIFLFLALLASYVLSEKYLIMILILNALSLVYSAPPLRLRRFPIVATLVIASGILIAILAGYMLFSKFQSLTDFPLNITFLILTFFTLVTIVKDLKDYEGDKANEVYTLPTIFGVRRSKIIIGILVFASFLLFPLLFLNSNLLFLISLGFGIISFLLIYDRKFREKYLFALYSVFLLLIFILTF